MLSGCKEAPAMLVDVCKEAPAMLVDVRGTSCVTMLSGCKEVRRHQLC